MILGVGCSSSGSNKSQGNAAGPDTVPKDSWSISNAQRAGRPLLIRRNDGLAAMANRAPYATRLTVSVTFHHPDDQGMPSGEESFALGSLEDSLTNQLTARAGSVFAAVVTGEGRRDYVFYTKAPAEADSLAKQIVQGQPGIAASVRSESDPSWSGYQGIGGR